MRRFRLLPLALCALSQPALAQTVPARPAPSQTAVALPASAPPRLIVAISVDQFSSDLFAEYRQYFTGGLRRLQQGVVFPGGYQSHAATETCPGHSTIMTGSHPARTGIVANDWIDQGVARADKTVYCAEDERAPGSTSTAYTVSDVHLKVPTLGERMKTADPRVRTVSIAGKDRAAVMMGGHRMDEIWWWDGKAFASYAGRPVPAPVERANRWTAAAIAAGSEDMALPPVCAAKNRAIPVGGGKSVGTGRFAREPGDARGFRASPAFDDAVADLANDLIRTMRLGQGEAIDVLTVGLSATDYIGHTYGTAGTETCIQMFALDRALVRLLDTLDATGADYVVLLTADHGGHDLPERNRDHAAPMADRAVAMLGAKQVGAAIQAKLRLKAQPLLGGVVGDMYIDRALKPRMKRRVLAEALTRYRAMPQVQAVFTAAEIAATPLPSGPPETWTTIGRARASFDPARSGDFYVVLRPRITPIVDPATGYVATHGSAWDYDRRVPILFWRRGMRGFEQPLSVETVDIAPTLAALAGLPIAPGEMDGRCLDLDEGPGSTCPGADVAPQRDLR